MDFYAKRIMNLYLISLQKAIDKFQKKNLNSYQSNVLCE